MRGGLTHNFAEVFGEKENAAVGWGWNPHLKIEMWGTRFTGGSNLGHPPIEGEHGFELGAGDGEVDAGGARAQVEALTWGAGRREDASDAAAQVGGAGEVGLGFGLSFDARAVQGEDSGERGDGAQGFGGALGRERDGVFEVEGRGHRRIVDGDAVLWDCRLIGCRVRGKHCIL